MKGRCDSGEPWKVVVVRTISMESGEGQGWSSHRCGREAEGRKGARAHWSRAMACKGKGKGARGMAVVGRERKGRSGAGGAVWRRGRGA
jgi:hypothetical protein